MADLNLDEKELAAGAAVAMDMAREDRKEAEQARKSSTSSNVFTVIFVMVSAIGMLVLMLAMGD